MPDPRSLSALHTGHVREGASKARRSAHAKAPTASSPAHPDAMTHMAFLLEPRLHTPAAPRLISHPSPRCAMRFTWIAAPPGFYAFRFRTIDHRVARSAR